MKKVFLLSILVTCSACSQSHDISLVGKWKSNEKLTLQSMHSTPGITDKAKKLFENHFFGQLLVEYNKDSYIAIYKGRKMGSPDGRKSYKIVEKGKDYIVAEDVDKDGHGYNKTTLYFVDNCYFVYVSKWKFKEFFCRYSQ